ncbi:hypothetical protein GQ53DRAFT_848002 [Thozetella sp. PMI_491]|nr:hypothetical protein GQ53DRAFT_848002 [Thozetella sp. PMI_491]
MSSDALTSSDATAYHETYSDLQVVPEKHPDVSLQPGMILVDQSSEHSYGSYSDETGKMVVSGPRYFPEGPRDGSTPLSCSETLVPPPQRPPRICGLAPKLFWALVGTVTLLIVTGAVVGGVVGSNRAKASNDASQHSTTAIPQGGSDTSASSSLPLGSSTPTPSTPLSVTTTTEVDVKNTLYRDCPSSNQTIYNALGSPQYQFRKLCEARYPGNGKTVVNKKAASLNDCVDLCASYNAQNKAAIAAGTMAVCNEVCWRHSLYSDYPGQCFASTYTNTSGGDFPRDFSNTECDSAAWMNQVV